MQIEFKGNNKWRELYEIYKKQRISKLPANTEQGFLDAVDSLRVAHTLNDLNEMKSLHLEKYKGWKYKGKYSVRCDKQFRLIFSVETSPEFILVLEEVTDPH